MHNVYHLSSPLITYVSYLSPATETHKHGKRIMTLTKSIHHVIKQCSIKGHAMIALSSMAPRCKELFARARLRVCLKIWRLTLAGYYSNLCAQTASWSFVRLIRPISLKHPQLQSKQR